MKFLLFFILSCLFFGQFSVSEKKSFHFLDFFLQKSDTKTTSSKKLKKKKTSRVTKSSGFSKSDFLSEDYYKAKNSKSKIMRKMKGHLDSIQKTCQTTKGNKKESLDRELEKFISFLKINLKDPYLYYDLKLMFGDILDVIEIEKEKEEEPSLMSAKSFLSSYSNLYNLPENIKLEDYPNFWAKAIYKALTCIDEGHGNTGADNTDGKLLEGN